MLRRWSSPRPLVGGLLEHECPRCHREVELPFGELCGACRAEIERRARRIARLVAGVTTFGVAVYVMLRLRGGDEYGRLVGLIGIAMWYVLTNLVVRRVIRIWQG